MTLDELKEAVQEFFGDKSRSAAETKAGLEEIADDAQMYADTLSDENDDSTDID